MSCFRPCPPWPCSASGPTPLASSCSEPYVAHCITSTVFIEPSPVVVTLP
ncbi:Feather keratin Cos1-1/Cos1-3/Cos2-1, partial [Tyto alba]